MTNAVASTKSASLAVQAQPQVAGFGRRAIAFAIDTMLVVVVLVLWMGVSDLLPLTGEDMYWIWFLIGFFFFITLPLFFAIALPVSFAASARVAGGRTLGKIVTGTAIRTDAGAAVGFGRVSSASGREAGSWWRSASRQWSTTSRPCATRRDGRGTTAPLRPSSCGRNPAASATFRTPSWPWPSSRSRSASWSAEAWQPAC
jgi:hypothetical protein